MGTAQGERTVARLLVECLEHEGVEYVFGLPGEENLHTIDALADSSIRFITTRDERGAAFMADTYGALTGRPGVCLATLGPGAINLMLGIANAHLDSHPLVAITAQAGLNRIDKESHQAVDLDPVVPADLEVGRHDHGPLRRCPRWCGRRSSRRGPSGRARRS